MPYNPFTNVAVFPNFAQGHVIEWKLDPVFVEASPYIFTVEVSETPDFSEIYLKIVVEDRTMAVDDSMIRQALSVDYWYRVKLETGDNHTYYSWSVMFGSQLETRRNYRLASEIIRKELLRLRKFTGIPMVLLKRKAVGEVPKDIVDPLSGVPITDNITDFGTGYKGGYFKPLKILASIDAYNNSKELNQAGLGMTENMQIKLRMIGYPTVEPYDIVVDVEADNRYLVKNATATLMPGTGIAVTQSIEAGALPTTDPVYQIEID